MRVSIFQHQCSASVNAAVRIKMKLLLLENKRNMDKVVL